MTVSGADVRPGPRAVAARLATPLGTLVGAAVVAAACGALVHRHGYVALAAVATTIAVGLAWPWATVRPLTATLAFDADRGREGVGAGFRLVVGNRGPLPAVGVVLTGLGGPPVPLAPIAGFGTLDVRLTVVPGRRGTCPPGPVGLACGRPFGLWHPARAVAVARPLLAWPAAAAVGLPPGLAGRRSAAATVAAAAAAGVAADEAHGVRAYRRGDPLKLVHHAQTARHDRLIVRELAGATRPAVRIAVDTAAASYAGRPASRELAIRVAAGLMAACDRAGIDWDAVVEGRVVRPGRDALDALARVAPAGGPGTGDGTGDGPGDGPGGPPSRSDGRPVLLVTSDAGRRSAGTGAVGSVVTVESVEPQPGGAE